jgi:hypothetical protein
VTSRVCIPNPFLPMVNYMGIKRMSITCFMMRPISHYVLAYPSYGGHVTCSLAERAIGRSSIG